MKNVLTNAFNKICLGAQKHSPEIFVIAGVVGVVTSAVLACKATTKVSTITADAKEKLNKINDCLTNESLKDEYTPEDGKKDKVIVYIQTGVKLACLYAPAVGLGVISIMSILHSNGILRKRNVALTAAYSATSKAFKEYRDRVIARFGEQTDKELKYNMVQKEIVETVFDENGKEKKVKKTVDVVDAALGCSEYARFFDESSPYWERNADYNLMFLRAEQTHANNLLRANGYLFLNEVYDRLGLPRTSVGQIVGWHYDSENPTGDNFVDFGIYDVHKEATRDFVNGYERSILLDFNVDGNILNLI